MVENTKENERKRDSAFFFLFEKNWGENSTNYEVFALFHAIYSSKLYIKGKKKKAPTNPPFGFRERIKKTRD